MGLVSLTVWIDDWQMQCCGEPFQVGSVVTWILDPKPEAGYLTAVLGEDEASRVTHYENHHKDELSRSWDQSYLRTHVGRRLGCRSVTRRCRRGWFSVHWVRRGHRPGPVDTSPAGPGNGAKPHWRALPVVANVDFGHTSRCTDRFRRCRTVPQTIVETAENLAVLFGGGPAGGEGDDVVDLTRGRPDVAQRMLALQVP